MADVAIRRQIKLRPKELFATKTLNNWLAKRDGDSPGNKRPVPELARDPGHNHSPFVIDSIVCDDNIHL